MNKNENAPDFDAEIPQNAISVYNNGDALEDFPVLKAFQQYIDAEQTKARKRLLTMGIFFGVLMMIVIAGFVAMLMSISARNQSLNDRLIEFAMRERDNRGSSAVVVQPPQDGSAIMALNNKLDEMRKKLEESQRQAEAAKAAAIEAAKAKEPSPAELEIQRLKAIIADEKGKVALEKERRHQEEIEAYRRKHYPELYEDEIPRFSRKARLRNRKTISELLDEIEAEDDDLGDDIDELPSPTKRHRKTVTDEDNTSLDAVKAINYFDEEGEVDDNPSPAATEKRSSEKPSPSNPSSPSQPKKKYSIPVDIMGSSSDWQIPNN